jgi:peptidoglycan/LPS O-acetylase OafA/YrhL
MLLIISISTDANVMARIFSSKIIYFLGIISYPLYLTHYLVFMRLPSINLFLQSHFGTNNHLAVLFSVYLVLSLIIAVVMTYAFEMPVIRFLNSRLFPKPKSAVLTD